MTMSTNWWRIKPYIDLTDSFNVTGVFPYILKKMVASCCKSCQTHETTEIQFLTSVRNSLDDVRVDLSQRDLNFPIYGSSDQDVYGGIYGYVPVISSPGEAYVVNREPTETSAGILTAVVLSCWPMVMLMLVFSILAGLVIWLLVN